MSYAPTVSRFFETEYGQRGRNRVAVFDARLGDFAREALGDLDCFGHTAALGH